MLTPQRFGPPLVGLALFESRLPLYSEHFT